MNSKTGNCSNQLKQKVELHSSHFEKVMLDDWNLKLSPEKWSKKETLGHLVDSAMNNIHRFLCIQYDDTNIYYDKNFWVKAKSHQNKGVESIIALWKLLNLQIAGIWEATTDDQLQKTISVKDSKPTLLFLIEDYMAHLQHHLGQILK